MIAKVRDVTVFVGLVLYVVSIASFVRIVRADKYDIGSEP
jgi:hypothetical protein